MSAGRLARLAGGRAGSGTEAEADAEGVVPAAAGRLFEEFCLIVVANAGAWAGAGVEAEAETSNP